MSLWQDKKGSRLEVQDESLCFFDKSGQEHMFGRVIVDAAPDEAAKLLPEALGAGPVGAVAPFFVDLEWGDKGPFCELVTIGNDQLLVRFTPKPQSWYSRQFSRIVLVETDRGAEVIRCLRSEVGSDLLQVKSPIRGAWAHRFQEGEESFRTGAWCGRSFALSQPLGPYNPAEFERETKPSYEDAAVSLSEFILEHLRAGHRLVGARVEESLALETTEYQELDEAMGRKATKRGAKAKPKKK